MTKLIWLDEMGTELLYDTKCPLCGKNTYVKIEPLSLMMYKAGHPIQEAFPTLDKSEREIILTGMCRDCQTRIFEQFD